MPADELGAWEPLGLDAAVAVFANASFRWWISGGHALDLHLGRSWRDHGDLDVGIVRRDLGAASALLAGWDLHVAAAGRLAPFSGQPLEAARHENNVWCRRGAGGPWALDLTVGEGSDEVWVYRRDPSVRLPWSEAVLRTGEGVPYLAPELQLLFKSRNPRPKDDIDAAEVVPALDDRRLGRLVRLLGPQHPWVRLGTR